MKASIITAIASLLFSMAVSASYWGAHGETIKEKADMSMMDISYPYFSTTTYCTNYYHTIVSGVPNNKDSMGFYAGTTYYGKDPAGHDSTSLQLTFWPASNKGVITPIWAFPGCNRTLVMNEGAACGMGGIYPLKSGQWYRHTIRFWKPLNPEEAKKKSYAGWWMKDLKGSGKWMLVQAAEIPIPDARFGNSGLGGFIECTYFVAKGPEKIRTLSWRNLYSHRDGKWESAHKFSLPAPTYQKLVLSEGDSVATARTYPLGPFDDVKAIVPSVHAELKQKAQPTIGNLTIAKATTQQNGSNLLVSWQLAETSTPQMRSQIDVLNASGESILRYDSNDPSSSEKLLELSGDQSALAKSVKITLTDIFDQELTKTANIQQTQERRGSKTVELIDPQPGVKTSFYEPASAKAQLKAGKTYANWNQLPDIDTLPLSMSIFQNNVSLDSMPRKFGVAFRVKSHLKIGKSGLYRFHFSACDGGRMLLGGKVFIEQSVHKSGNSVSQWIVLDQGYYPLVLEGYSDAGTGSNFIRPRLELAYEGPGITKQPVPSSALYLAANDRPQVSLDWRARPRTGAGSNTVDIRLGKFEGNRDDLDRVEIIDAKGTIWTTFLATEFSTMKTILLPEQEHQLSARLYFKDKVVIDLPAKAVSVKNPPASFWTLVKPDGAPARAFGYRVSKESVTLAGDGRRWAVREVTGDFVYQMRVKNFRNVVNKASPVTNDPRAGFGFCLQHRAESPYDYRGFHWSHNMYSAGHYDTPTRHDGGLAQKNYHNSFHRVPLPVSYFRFSRKGDYFKAELRATEKDPWKLLFEETVKLPKKVFIGPYMQYLPSMNPHSYWQADFDQIKITQ